MIRQRTLKSIVKATGVGLHGGRKVTLTLRPAAPDTGIVFHRVDLDPPLTLPADPYAVCDTRMCSGLEKGGHKVVLPDVDSESGRVEYTPDVMQGFIDALPRRYRALKTGYRFYVGSKTFANIVRNNAILPNQVYTAERTAAWLDGAGQLVGQAGVQTRVLGVPVIEVPHYPDDYIELTFPQNRIWGLQRDIKISREYQTKKDTIEWTVFLRFGIAWEELDAMAWAEAPEADTEPETP